MVALRYFRTGMLVPVPLLSTPRKCIRIKKTRITKREGEKKERPRRVRPRRRPRSVQPRPTRRPTIRPESE